MFSGMGVNNWSSFYIFQNRVVETLHYMKIYQMFMKYCKDKRRNMRIDYSIYSHL